MTVSIITHMITGVSTDVSERKDILRCGIILIMTVSGYTGHQYHRVHFIERDKPVNI